MWPRRKLPNTGLTRVNKNSQVHPILTIILAVVVFLAQIDCGYYTACGSPTDYTRPTVQEIRSETRRIVEDSRYAPRKTLSQWLFERLRGLFSLSVSKLPKGVGRVFAGFLIIWCVLSLLVVMGHLIWTIAVLFRNRTPRQRRASSRMSLMQERMKYSYDELRKLMERFASQGDFNKAIGLMMLALLRWLDGCGVLAFHESKSNGDYLREYNASTVGYAPFRSFATSFDAVIYGGVNCDFQIFDRMKNLFEQVRQDVEKIP
jgi:hypothetical protein